jgi:hypothetical protein
MLSPHVVLTATSTARLRDELAWLRARHDEGAVAPCVYRVIKQLESELAWRQHAEHADPRAQKRGPTDRVSGQSPNA